MAGNNVMPDEDVVPLLEEDSKLPAPPIKKRFFRYVIVLLLAFGFLTDYFLRINISFALDGGMIPNNCTHDEPRCWSQKVQGYILSSFYWGYWVSQLPGAVACCYFKASTVFGTGLSIAIVANVFQPLVADLNVWFLLSLRVLIGLGQGVTFPVALNIITSWAPTSEVGLFTALASGGQYIGAILANSVSGLLAGGTFLEGWPSLFYVYSAIGVTWAALWFTFVRDSPEDSRWVSDSEKDLLRISVPPKKVLVFSEIPWRRILTSGPVLSAVLMHGLNGFGYFMILSDLPKYMVEQLHFNIKDSGFVASVPYIMTWLGFVSSGKFSDLLISKNVLSTSRTRKVIGLAALTVPAILLFSLSYFNDTVPILVFMNIAMYFQGFANSAYYVNYIDLSPRFSAVLCGVGNSLCAAMGLLGPLFVGFLIDGIPAEETSKLRGQWRIAFAVASVLWIIGSVQYCVFGSGERQSWDNVEDKDGFKGIQTKEEEAEIEEEGIINGESLQLSV